MAETSTPLALNLKRLRCRAGLTVSDLARRAGLHMTYVYMMENGVRDSPSADVLRRLAGVIGCSVSDFFRENRHG